MNVLLVEPGIVGRDRATLERFYTEAMGFEITHRFEFDGVGTVVRLRRDQAKFKLFFPPDPLDPPRDDDPWYRAGGFRYAALYLDTAEAVDALAEACVAGGGRLLSAPMEHRPGARVAVVLDPEGNPWELLYG